MSETPGRRHLRETAEDWATVQKVLPQVPRLRRERDDSETAEQRAVREHRERQKSGRG